MTNRIKSLIGGDDYGQETNGKKNQEIQKNKA